ncbi:hypothetical protein PM8797T_29518 [Gimesia maris DSM 8797]|nr:hypothetical protein PM8797T_29518 [Gimesia maris DSM 8797]
MVVHRNMTAVEDGEAHRSARASQPEVVVLNPISFLEPVTLERLRQAWPNFQPPQGFRYLDDEQASFVKSFVPPCMNKPLIAYALKQSPT